MNNTVEKYIFSISLGKVATVIYVWWPSVQAIDVEFC